MKKILLVDDDREALDLMRRYLEGRGFRVVFTDNGSEALLLARESRPDLVVADAVLPGLDGLELCKALKCGSDTAAVPVIIISGRRIGDEDIVAGYEKGADDYLVKPFSFQVLAAKIGVVLRRYDTFHGVEGRIERLGMVVDPSDRTVTVGDASVSLTRKEFDLLTALMQARGRLLSVSCLLETVWGYDPAGYNDPHTVRVHVASLRRKLGLEIGAHIVSVLGHGYKFE
ncbi:MAG TPA: response regulator transcription factor [Elusimicrobiales bacterium]|nr:response regulator transcription factor [Elusimicrobiales bacterium]